MDKPCKISKRAVNNAGYPKLNKKYWGHNSEHRWVYSVYNDHYVFQPGDVVMHLCDNKRCIEPTHLKLGTTKDNNIDMFSKQRNRNGTTVLTEEEVRWIRDHPELEGTYLAQKFKVSPATISRIKTGQAWRGVRNQRRVGMEIPDHEEE